MRRLLTAALALSLLPHAHASHARRQERGGGTPPADSEREAARESYKPPPMSSEARRDAEAKLATAREAYEKNPSDADAVIWLGRRTAYLGRFDEAIEIFTEGIRKHPRDPRLYRHRGHRHITTRRLDAALKDLETAARLIRGRSDEVEPDGIPNARGVPTSTLNSNVWYHLGLARYLRGDFRGARAAYRECLKFSKNPDMLAATTHWLYMTLRRMGRKSEARRALARVDDDAEVIENHDYRRLILMYRGKIKPERLLEEVSADMNSVSYATTAYGVGNWYLYNGERGRAADTLVHIMQWPQRTSFGYIAAEADLRRLGVRGYPREPGRPA